MASTPAVVMLAVDSFVLLARLAVRVDDDQVVHVSFVHYENWLGRVLWAVAAPVHHVLVPYLLNHAARHPG